MGVHPRHTGRRFVVYCLLSSPSTSYARQRRLVIRPNISLPKTARLGETALLCALRFQEAPPLFGVQNDLEQKQANGRKDNVIPRQHSDPQPRIGVAGKNGVGGQHHAQQRGDKNGKQQ